MIRLSSSFDDRVNTASTDFVTFTQLYSGLSKQSERQLHLAYIDNEWYTLPSLALSTSIEYNRKQVLIDYLLMADVFNQADYDSVIKYAQSIREHYNSTASWFESFQLS